MTASSPRQMGFAAAKRPCSRRVGRRRILAGLLGGLLLSSAAGTAEWVSTYGTARQLATERNQPLCLYFRVASSPACQNFEAQVLSQPSVGAALAGFVMVYLDPAWNETLAEKYGVYRVPAVVLAGPNEVVLYREQGNLSANSLLRALSEHGVRFQPREQASPEQPPGVAKAEPPAAEEHAGIVTMPVPEAARLKPIRVRARAPEAGQLRLHFRLPGEKDYLSVPMRKLPQQEWWEGDIPAWIVTPKGVEYYLTALRGEQTIAVPRQFDRKPFVVKVH